VFFSLHINIVAVRLNITLFKVVLVININQFLDINIIKVLKNNIVKISNSSYFSPQSMFPESLFRL
jgi:hypothetical protein